MRICSGIKADGSRCRAFAMKGSDYCLNHDPNRVEEHRRRSSRGGKRGGRGRPRVELSYIRAQLQDLKDSVLDGSVERGDASVAGNLLNYMTRCIQIELAAREQEELVDRLEKLEQALEEQRKMSGRGVAQNPLRATRMASTGTTRPTTRRGGSAAGTGGDAPLNETKS